MNSIACSGIQLDFHLMELEELCEWVGMFLAGTKS